MVETLAVIGGMLVSGLAVLYSLWSGERTKRKQAETKAEANNATVKIVKIEQERGKADATITPGRDSNSGIGGNDWMHSDEGSKSDL